MKENDQDFMAELRAYYLSTAEEKVGALRELYERLTAAPGDEALAEDLRRRVHSIAGSAGSYGVDALSRMARAFLHEVDAARARLPFAPAFLQRVDGFRETVRRVFEEARAGREVNEEEYPRYGPGEDAAHAPTVARARRKVVAVIGSGGALTAAQEKAAREVGAAVARAGAHLVCGGLGGVMEAACRGYREAGGEGLAVGVLPGDSPTDANAFVDLALPTGLGKARNLAVVLSADGVIAVGGAGGTLSEVGLAAQHGKRIAAVAGSRGTADLVAGRSVDPHAPPIHSAADAASAVAWVLSDTN